MSTPNEYTPTEGDLVLHEDFGVCRIVRDDEGLLALMLANGHLRPARCTPNRWARLVGPLPPDYQQTEAYKRHRGMRQRYLCSYDHVMDLVDLHTN
jgi:hypothetical protein